MLSLLTRLHHRFENLHIPGTAAKVTCESIANLSFSRIRSPLEQIHCGDHHSRSTDPTLRSTVVNKGLLDGMKFLIPGDSFNRSYFTAVDLTDRNETAVYDLPIEQHGTRATFAFAATFFGAR